MRLKFDARSRAILRRVPRINVYSATELALLAALAVQGARLMWAIVTPISPLGAWAPSGPVLPSDPAGVFRSFDPFYRVSGAQASGPSAVTAMQLTLFGTRIDAAQGGGSAIVAGPDGVQKSIAVGEEVAPGVTLKAVAFDHVTLDRGGVAEDLFLTQPEGGTIETTPGATPPVPPGVPPAAVMPAPPMPQGIAKPSASLRGDVSAIPRIDGGGVSGVTVRSNGGSAFRAAGLRDGDVVTQVDGLQITSAADLDRLGSGSVNLTVERNGRPQTLTVRGNP